MPTYIVTSESQIERDENGNPRRSTVAVMADTPEEAGLVTPDGTLLVSVVEDSGPGPIDFSDIEVVTSWDVEEDTDFYEGHQNDGVTE